MGKNKYYIILGVGILGLFAALVLPGLQKDNQVEQQLQVVPSKSNSSSMQNSQLTLSLAPGSKTIKKGEVLEVSVQAETARPLLAIDLHIAYDGRYLELMDMSPGDMFENPITLANKKDNQAGTALYSLGSTKVSKQKGRLARLTFKALAPYDKSIVTISQKSVASSEGGQKVPIILSNQGIYSVY